MKTEFWKILRVTLSWLALTLPSAWADPAASSQLVTNQPAQSAGPDVSITPAATYAAVRGDHAKFREDTGMKDGWSGGVEEFTLHQKLDKDAYLNFEGRGIFDQHDYKLRLEVVKPEVGFIRAGFTQYREYDDSVGGYYRPFTKGSFDPEKNPAMDIGNIFVDIGLTMPNLPKVTLGYERQYRDGTQSLLEWGGVAQTLAPTPPAQPSGTVTKKIYPSFQAVDEAVDIFKVDVEHDIKNVHLGDEFRYEYDNDATKRMDDVSLIEPATSPSKTVTARENYENDNFSNVFHMESWLNDKLFCSLGYMFSTLNGSDGLGLNTVPYGAPFDVDWFTKDVDLEMDSNVLNLGFLFGPFAGLMGYGGIQAEKTDTDGNGVAVLTQYPDPVGTGQEVTFESYDNQKSLEEDLGLRYTTIPYTTLYVEGRWTEQGIYQFENETDVGVPSGPDALKLKTDTGILWQEYTAGFNTAPFRNLTLSAQYRHSIQDYDYDYKVDTIVGYPGFINGQRLTTDELNTQLTLRPMSKLSIAFRYQLEATDIDTDTQPVAALGIPGGTLHSGDYDSGIYTVSMTATPFARLYLTGLFSYQDTRTIAYDHDSHSIATYRGNVYTVVGTMGYAIDDKTDLTAEYTYSRADDLQNNGFSNNPKAGSNSNDFGLPLGVDNERHALTATLAHKFTKSIVGRLRYGFYDYRDPGLGGADNYLAQVVSAGCTIRF